MQTPVEHKFYKAFSNESYLSWSERSATGNIILITILLSEIEIFSPSVNINKQWPEYNDLTMLNFVFSKYTRM